jgi:hypothetical protein
MNLAAPTAFVAANFASHLLQPPSTNRRVAMVLHVLLGAGLIIPILHVLLRAGLIIPILHVLLRAGLIIPNLLVTIHANFPRRMTTRCMSA